MASDRTLHGILHGGWLLRAHTRLTNPNPRTATSHRTTPMPPNFRPRRSFSRVMLSRQASRMSLGRPGGGSDSGVEPSPSPSVAGLQEPSGNLHLLSRAMSRLSVRPSAAQLVVDLDVGEESEEDAQRSPPGLPLERHTAPSRMSSSQLAEVLSPAGSSTGGHTPLRGAEQGWAAAGQRGTSKGGSGGQEDEELVSQAGAEGRGGGTAGLHHLAASRKQPAASVGPDPNLDQGPRYMDWAKGKAPGSSKLGGAPERSHSHVAGVHAGRTRSLSTASSHHASVGSLHARGSQSARQQPHHEAVQHPGDGVKCSGPGPQNLGPGAHGSAPPTSQREGDSVLVLGGPSPGTGAPSPAAHPPADAPTAGQGRRARRASMELNTSPEALAAAAAVLPPDLAAAEAAKRHQPPAPAQLRERVMYEEGGAEECGVNSFASPETDPLGQGTGLTIHMPHRHTVDTGEGTEEWAVCNMGLPLYFAALQHEGTQGSLVGE